MRVTGTRVLYGRGGVSMPSAGSAGRTRGLHLIELMVVVLIIGI
jgi:prepilin-type N-terminal cleavage/methylation domain-containing protein